jgi:murein DD-endopeptidase MepM/ murein hydrolase activator NlpD
MTKPLITYTNPHSGGKFAAVRKYDIHTGIDLYCEENSKVFAIEKGIVVNICNFTGEKAESPWWENTQAILIEGKSGVILYGEVSTNLHIDDKVKEGQIIGEVLRVLKKNKGLPMTMLHLELYKRGYRGNGEIWNLNENKPEMLLNPNILL